MTSKFTKIKFQKSSEESVEKGDEVTNEYKAGAWLFLYCSESLTLQPRKSDQNLISPHNIIPESHIKVTRVKEMISK